MKKSIICLALAGFVCLSCVDKIQPENPGGEGPAVNPVTPDEVGELPALPDPEDVCSAMDDELFVEYCLSNFDLGGDGKISVEEAAQVRAICISGLEIASIAGVEYFSNLEKIECQDCEHLASADLGYNHALTTISANAFALCSNLKSVRLPQEVSAIGEGAFLNSKALSKINFPKMLFALGDNAFYGCTSLRNITLPRSVASLGSSVFGGCGGTCYLNCNVPDARPGCLSAFAESKFSEIVMGAGVTLIGNRAFDGCSTIANLTFARTVVAIGDEAFRGLAKLSILGLPYGLETIGDGAFEGCTGLAGITLPATVKAIGNRAFFDCTKVLNVYSRPVTPPSCGTDAFGNNAKNRKIYVPKSSLDLYKSSPKWTPLASDLIGYKF